VERISLMFCLFANVNVPTSEKWPSAGPQNTN
jgi:hypothetical protein